MPTAKQKKKNNKHICRLALHQLPFLNVIIIPPIKKLVSS